ncbi:response regulator transcription factor [Qipengyuania spongiae]|uniref:Response regulator n=1 Tax=Qipengyuania spongiae TaxID=2909673 RepID=A0ABY5SYH0_9SPHN|nr:response regulator [Qipengyuania spongiae]UVI39585.1 response regulator [Qipengyuania spongiae]
MTTIDTKIVHIVDDEREIRDSLSVLLRSIRFEPKPWKSGTDFLNGFRSAQAGCVLLDVCMPGADGFLVQEELASESHLFPIIMISAHGDTARAVQAIRGGARDFLSKPFTRHQLEDALTEAQNWADDSKFRARLALVSKARLAKLNAHEREILMLMSQGHSERLIAFVLGLPLDDVEICRELIFLKLEVSRTASAVRVLLDAE